MVTLIPTNSGSLFNADTITYTAGDVAPTLTTQAASPIDAIMATLNGTITVGLATSRGFEYGISTSYGSVVSTIGSYVTGAFTTILSSLSPNTTYHARSFATSGSATGYGNDISFTTLTLGGRRAYDDSSNGGGSSAIPTIPAPVTSS